LQQADDRVTVSTLAFVFPGQGSQSVGMVAELAELHPQVREAFTEASDGAGVDLWALSQGGPEEMLNRTEYTAGPAGREHRRVARLERRGRSAPVGAGHSLGSTPPWLPLAR
jgi:[acyl-carrier-protein] S-malonyltransferase